MPKEPKEELRFVREPEVVEKTALSRTTIWRMEKDDLFPKRRRISVGAVGWINHEIDEWIESRTIVGGSREEDA